MNEHPEDPTPEDSQPKPTEELTIDLYADLRKIAKRQLATLRPDRMIQTTGLVHDVFLKMSNFHTSTHWNDDAHFLSAASKTMRRVVIDRSRTARTQKRGKGSQQLPIDLENLPERTNPLTQHIWEAFDEGVQLLEQEDPMISQFARLRVYSGLSVTEAGAQLGLCRSTSYELWSRICEWFKTWDEDCQ